MKRFFCLLLLWCLIFVKDAGAQEESKVFLLDGFEGPIVAGQTIGAEAGNGSSVSVAADTVFKHGGNQSLKITYDAVSGGYIWVARGIGTEIDPKGAGARQAGPAQIPWANYGAISFYMKGEGRKMQMTFDIKDADGEIFRFTVTDDSTEWKQVVCSFAQFLARDDGQSGNAPTKGTLDFPIKSFLFEPVAEAAGQVNIDDVSLEPLN